MLLHFSKIYDAKLAFEPNIGNVGNIETELPIKFQADVIYGMRIMNFLSSENNGSTPPAASKSQIRRSSSKN